MQQASAKYGLFSKRKNTNMSLSLFCTLTLSHFYSFTLFFFHTFTRLHFHTFTISLSHTFTRSLLHTFTCSHFQRAESGLISLGQARSVWVSLGYSWSLGHLVTFGWLHKEPGWQMLRERGNGFPERSGSSTKGRNPSIRYFVAKLSIVAIYVFFGKLL